MPTHSLPPPPLESRLSVVVRWGLILNGIEALLLALLLLYSANHNVDRIFFVLIRSQDSLAWPIFTCVAIAAALLSSRLPGTLAIARSAAHRPGLLAAVALLAYAAGAVYAYRATPLAMDEYVPLLQSRIFAAGRLHGVVPLELVDDAFFAPFRGHFFAVDPDTGAFASKYWPAFAALLTPFSTIGLEWLFNPLITALTIVAMDSLLRKIGFDEVDRGIALVAVIASAAIAVNAMSFYAMPLLLLSNVIFTRLILQATPGCLLAAGAIGSIGLTAINPVPHTLYAIPWILWLALRSQPGWRALPWLALGYLPGTALLGIGWTLCCGELGSATRPGSGANIAAMFRTFEWPSPGLLLTRAFALTKLDLWAIPGLLPVAVAGIFLWRDAIGRTFTWSVLLTVAGYLFVPFDQGHGWGYRYFHQSWVALPALAAAAIPRIGPREAADRLRVFLVLSCAGSLLLLLPLRTLQVEQFVARHQRQIPPRVASDARQIVFVDPRCGYHVMDLIQNDPFLRGNELRFVSQGPDRDLQIAARLLGSPVVTARTDCAERWIGR